jgi:hypothetical protein
MTPNTDTPDDPSQLNTLFASLARSERRELLSILGAASEPPTEEELAVALCTRAESPGNADPDGEHVARARQQLHHVHLPKLEAARLIVRDTDSETEPGTVRRTNHPAYEDEGIVDCLAADDGAEDSLGALFEALAAERRRTVLDVLSHQFHPIHLETLARELKAREAGTAEQAVPSDAVERCCVDLRHAQLPMLADAGLIEYDREEGTVAYEGHPCLRVPWMHSTLGPNFRSQLTGDADRELGTLDDRESVISYGQWLVERADEELFCLFTHMDMLEAGCFSRVVRAAREGVDVYLGTADPTVREFVQETVPEVVLWEPETDWLNLPVEGDRVGRLMMADREAVMLGTLKEPVDDKTPAEKAIVGEGADNTLVVMVRQLVSAHLEDIGREETETNLPV